MGRASKALSIAVILGAIALFVARDGGTDTQASAGTAAEPRAGCTERQATERVQDFSEALRTADLDALKIYWGDRFKWFSVGTVHSDHTKENFLARSPREALRYISEQDGLPMRLTKIDVNAKYKGSRGMGYEGRWGSRRIIIGKADLICSSPEIRVWSMAVNPPGTALHP